MDERIRRKPHNNIQELKGARDDCVGIVFISLSSGTKYLQHSLHQDVTKNIHCKCFADGLTTYTESKQQESFSYGICDCEKQITTFVV